MLKCDEEGVPYLVQSLEVVSAELKYLLRDSKTIYNGMVLSVEFILFNDVVGRTPISLGIEEFPEERPLEVLNDYIQNNYEPIVHMRVLRDFKTHYATRDLSNYTR